MHLDFRRIQFTPDLVPSDITGTEILEEDTATRRAQLPVRARAGVREHRARRRNQPRAAAHAGRAARGDAGASRDRAGDTMALPEPFFVLATQNPIEQEGTYPLPEAQLDRFLFDIRIGYPRRGRRDLDPARDDRRGAPPLARGDRRDRGARAAATRARGAGGGARAAGTRRRSRARRGRTRRRRPSSCGSTCAGAPGRARARR